MIKELFYLLVFPGFLFISAFALAGEYIDRKLYARFQNRVGPPWFQPLADFIKLLAKEDIVPCDANANMFKIVPVFALTSAVAAIIYVPLWQSGSIYSFPGDVIVVLYLLTIPTLCFFMGGWYSTSLFARIGSVRTLTQLFAYEVPLFMSILSAAVLADSWSFQDIVNFYNGHPGYLLFNGIGFVVSMIALLGKLEKTPFDIPEAETEIVAGSFTEYSGRLLAIFRLTLDIEMVVGAALISAIFIPFGLNFSPVPAFIITVIKIELIIAMLSLARTIFARLRIDQMVNFCWKYIVPLALTQLLINFLIKGFFR